jgi:hypothetical protein
MSYLPTIQFRIFPGDEEDLFLAVQKFCQDHQLTLINDSIKPVTVDLDNNRLGPVVSLIGLVKTDLYDTISDSTFQFCVTVESNPARDMDWERRCKLTVLTARQMPGSDYEAMGSSHLPWGKPSELLHQLSAKLDAASGVQRD